MGHGRTLQCMDQDKQGNHVSLSDYIYVCLVNTGYGIPFISVLELRPLSNEIYYSKSRSALQLDWRCNFGLPTNSQGNRYKNDAYDRLWSTYEPTTWIPLNNTFLTDEDSISKNDYELPLTVMSTAYTINRSSSDATMSFYWSSLNQTSTYCFYMHFAELEKLQNNQSREFNIYLNEDLIYRRFIPEYLYTATISSGSAGIEADSKGKIVLELYSTNNRSTLPPLINALGMFVLKEFSLQETNQIDVEAILNVKSVYQLTRNRQVDPCASEAYLWDGLNCSYNTNSPPPRIVSLNLSSSGLKGKIVSSIANMTMLQYLDLSNNNLSGTVPEFLAQLSVLKVLNLKGNNFTGPVPDAFFEKMENGLLLSIGTNQSSTPCSSGSCGNKKKFVTPLVASLGGVLFIFLTIVAVFWILKRRKQREATDLQGILINNS